MLIDFGNGEAIMAHHEESTLRDLEARELKRMVSSARPRRARLHHYADRLLCEMDYWRLVLADRLHRIALAQSLLRAEDTTFFSTSQCR